MSTLILLLAAQPRLAASAPEPRVAVPEFDFALSVDGQRITQQGRAAADRLPAAAAAVAVLAPGDVSFHRVALPKAPAARMRAALAGMMEEALLEDEADVHFALAPEAKAGETHWVAVVNRPWLKAQLDALDAAGIALDRAVPAWWPDDAPAGHVHRRHGELQLAWRDAQGAVCVPLASELARALVAAAPADTPVRWTAAPDAAADASQFAGTAAPAVTDAEQGLRAARSGWNLRQFDLVAQRRGVRQLRDGAARLAFDPAWRVVRVGLVLLVVAQLAGLNVRAWQERQSVQARRDALAGLVTRTFPNVKSVSEPGLQAQREIDLLRAAAGRPGDADLETFLQAAESAWPADRPPVEALKFESGRLTMTATGWPPAAIERFRTQLRASGYDVDAAGDRLVLTRARPGVKAST